MVTNVLFIDIIFNNVDSVAGYSRDEILLFNLYSQIWFFVLYFNFTRNIEIFIQSVNNGQLDLILTKPINSLFYILLRNINTIAVLRNAIPSILILIISIDWNNINITEGNLIASILIAILGIIISICINFLAALPVIWLGYNQAIMDIVFMIEDNSGHSNFVYEMWSEFWRFFFTIIFPTAIASGLATSVVLGKQPALQMLLLTVLVTIMFLFITVIAWRKSIRSYSSASS
jgi:ABC-2 type transport system permease protein